MLFAFWSCYRQWEQCILGRTGQSAPVPALSLKTSPIVQFYVALDVLVTYPPYYGWYVCMIYTYIYNNVLHTCIRDATCCCPPNPYIPALLHTAPFRASKKMPPSLLGQMAFLLALHVLYIKPILSLLTSPKWWGVWEQHYWKKKCFFLWMRNYVSL